MNKIPRNIYSIIIFKLFLLSIFFFLCSQLLSQPSNDECEGAIELTLTAIPDCPIGGTSSDAFSFNNIDATATTPYPSFTNCNPGGATDGPAAEVWFYFTATGNFTNITVAGGLNTPNIVFLSGNDCEFLNTVACAKGSGNVTIELNTLVGVSYFLFVSGEDIDDQGVLLNIIKSW